MEGGGVLRARHLHINATHMTVDAQGVVDVSYGGLAAGDGAGTGTAGGSYGGRGGLSRSPSECRVLHCELMLFVISCNLFHKTGIKSFENLKVLS